MTDDRIPFLRAILLDVTAAAPRLVYADWLEDQGECERSEFVRVQCGLLGAPPFVSGTLQSTSALLGAPSVEVEVLLDAPSTVTNGAALDLIARYPGNGATIRAFGVVRHVVTRAGDAYCRLRVELRADPLLSHRIALRCREAELFQASIFECVAYWRKLVAWNDEQIELEAAVRDAGKAAVAQAARFAAAIAERGEHLYPPRPKP